jgi:hypothetical protein
MIIIFWEMTPCGSYKNHHRHLPEDDNHYYHGRGNLKSYEEKFVLKEKLTQVNLAIIEESGERYAWSTTATDMKLITAYSIFK